MEKQPLLKEDRVIEVTCSCALLDWLRGRRKVAPEKIISPRSSIKGRYVPSVSVKTAQSNMEDASRVISRRKTGWRSLCGDSAPNSQRLTLKSPATGKRSIEITESNQSGTNTSSHKEKSSELYASAKQIQQQTSSGFPVQETTSQSLVAESVRKSPLYSMRSLFHEKEVHVISRSSSSQSLEAMITSGASMEAENTNLRLELNKRMIYSNRRLAEELEGVKYENFVNTLPRVKSIEIKEDSQVLREC